MYIKIHGNADYVKGNTQSCKDLVDYLEKENEEKDFPQQEFFFNQTSINIEAQRVIQIIDNNKKGLKEKDAKFFMVTVNPSERELKHLASLATGGKEINEISEMTPGELQTYNDLIKNYARQVMDDYANAFNRGITGKDLVYFGKLEQQRHFKGNETEVTEGLKKSGELKEGIQTHVHIVVSRKDVTQKMSLSPLANSKGSEKHQLNGKSVKVGFDRDLFVNGCEGQFDRMYGYKRDFENTYAYYKFSSNPHQGLQQASRIARQMATNPELAAKNLVITGIDELTGTKVASTLKTASHVIQNPESLKNVLINKLDQVATSLLPPEVKAAKKAAEVVIKPVMEIIKGGLEI